MISDIWTLKTDAESDEATLAEWGFVSGDLSRVSQGADVLTLGLSVADAAATDALWAWDTPVTLYRDSEVFFRGWVSFTPRDASDSEEGMSYEIKNVWWLLERTTFLQQWQTARGAVYSPTSSLGRNATDDGLVSTKEILSLLGAFASTEGIAVSFDTSRLQEVRCPLIEGHGLTLATLIRRVMEWHPGAVVVASYSASGTTLHFISRAYAGSRDVSVVGKPNSAYRVVARNDLVPDSVHVYYETAYDEIELASENGPLSSTRKALMATDVYPLGSSRTRQSMVVTMPVEYVGGETYQPSAPTPEEVPIKTRVLPRSGASDLEAEQWWLDHSGLGLLGITTNDFYLPSASTAEMLAHTIEIVESELPAPPSAINPNSTPVYRAPSIDDLPNELVEGHIKDWMDLLATPVSAMATLVVRKSAADALPEENREQLYRMNPREGTLAGIPALFFDAQQEIIGTEATTKVYSYSGGWNPIGADAATVEALNAQGQAEALEAAVIPDLARNLYLAHAELFYEGFVKLTEREAAATNYFGETLNLYHESRAEWSTMRAVIQSEEISLTKGTTRLSFGPPRHLAVQNWSQLHAAARHAQQARKLLEDAPPTPNSADNPRDADEAGERANSPISGAAVGPRHNFAWRNGGNRTAQPWDLVVDDGSVTVRLGTILQGEGLVTDGLTCTNPTASFTPAAGDLLLIRFDDEHPTSYTLELSTGWPIAGGYPVSVDGSNAYVKSYELLWEFSSTREEGAVTISSGVYGLRAMPPTHLRVSYSYMLAGASNLRAMAPFLLPGYRVVGA